MTKSDLLKEAIADAKAVRETAIANAKIALQESFSPRIQSMLASKLAEDLEDDEDLEGMEGEGDLEGMEGEGDFEGELDGMEGELDGEAGFEPGDSVGSAELDVDIDGDGETPDSIDMVIPDEEMEAGMEGEMGDEEGPELDMGDEEDDLELESIIAELEGEMGNSSEIDSIDTLNIDDEDPEIMDEDIDSIINSILSEEEELEEMDDPAAAEDGSGRLKEELDNAYSTIESLRSTLQEVNLLNAKLLYTNKLFRAFDLNEGQRVKVIENFDRASSTREVKLVFSTLAESLTRKVSKPKAMNRKIVKEHKNIASRSTGTTKPSEKTTQRIISEGNEQTKRFQKLAGIIK